MTNITHLRHPRVSEGRVSQKQSVFILIQRSYSWILMSKVLGYVLIIIVKLHFSLYPLGLSEIQIAIIDE